MTAPFQDGDRVRLAHDMPSLIADVLALRTALRRGMMEPVADFPLDDLGVEVCRSRASLCLLTPFHARGRDFTVRTRTRNDDRFGQTDVGGVHAQLMLLSHQLTGKAIAFLLDRPARVDIVAIGIDPRRRELP